jgi:hypothetical protein
MGSVGGSRHYTGGGLGAETGWKCPSCGAENTGPIAQGCQLCGAGKPGQRAADPPPPPPPRAEALKQDVEQDVDEATAWVKAHPRASITDAYTAGYVEGFRAARRQLLDQQEQQRADSAFAPEGKVGRTMIAALELFRDQILASQPEEVQSGEWLSAHEVSQLIQQLQQQLREVAHA